MSSRTACRRCIVSALFRRPRAPTFRSPALPACVHCQPHFFLSANPSLCRPQIHRLATAHALERNEKFVGKEVEVLVEVRNVKNPTQVMGRTRLNKQVFFEADIDDVKGKLVMVKVTEARAYSLTGERIEGVPLR